VKQKVYPDTIDFKHCRTCSRLEIWGSIPHLAFKSSSEYWHMKRGKAKQGQCKEGAKQK